ncbi:hypothetical protein L6452_05180 [Arctium lappa]|uniref:Uncharacterized protein n=1 Tax=Arctium lappa TaxID=4217 RepID=A0ACB9EFN6_ARCLA|nr:hypothetical protein L6452_05180 [Arctium lappa]
MNPDPQKSRSSQSHNSRKHLYTHTVPAPESATDHPIHSSQHSSASSPPSQEPFSGGGNHQVVIPPKFLHIVVDPDADEGVSGVAEEICERSGDYRGAEDLEDETTAADAELESGDWVFVIASVVGTPFDVEADDEGVESGGVDVFGVGDPGVDDGGCVCDGGGDGVLVECDVVHVVGVGGELVIHDGRRHRR